MKSPMEHTAMRVKHFGNIPVVEVSSFDNRYKTKTESLVIFKTNDDIVFLGADDLNPFLKGEIKIKALEAIKLGKGKAQIEARQIVSELESSKKRQMSRAKQFHDAISDWSYELSSLSNDIKNGMDIPSIRSRLTAISLSMEKLQPKK